MQSVVDRVREFNRGWSDVLGLLDQGLLETEHSLAEGRVIFEFAQRTTWSRSDLRRKLGMDPSFLSRILARLERDGLITSKASPVDGRALDLSLTAKGRRAFANLDARASSQISEIIASLTDEQRATLVESMAVISNLIRPAADRTITIRELQAGDLGWVVQRHGAVYEDEFGWNDDFEALVARIVADYHDGLNPVRENAWIATVDGARAGCVFCCDQAPDEPEGGTAKLRILLVERWARGLGLGSRLVDECIGFARRAGYTKVTLWTNDILVAARHIYQAAGFVLVDEQPHHSFGHDLVGQTWELDLDS